MIVETLSQLNYLINPSKSILGAENCHQKKLKTAFVLMMMMMMMMMMMI